MSQDPGQKYANDGANFVKFRHDTYPAIDPTKADLSGKYVFITGASKGVGKAAAISYAQAGASGIALGARSPLEEVAKEVVAAARKANRKEPQVLTLQLDVTSVKSVADAAAEVSKAFDDRLDILVNNAGYLSSFVPIVESDPDEWWRDWEVNVKGVYLMTRAFIPLLLRNASKIIINMTSLGAHMFPPGGSSYCSGKLAVLRFSEFVNDDYAKEDILAISVHPGGVKTELALNMPDFMHSYLVDEPELAADALVWLTSERREWLKGRYVTVNWDVEELEGRKEDILKGDLLKVRMAVNLFPDA
ncbi:oxidoreductase-like protein [Pleomassaria siparia CBS 279.74]|uniref:Oxidoreductase-like protein n=1 Tax=Pleomassaria siparia CBS 279.74 TaxID=1314801 RepID=A0A6G1KQ50_9PLEO|nr:oxidoreductase-like protein [Pleomassaria siparia CBS 279.74]